MATASKGSSKKDKIYDRDDKKPSTSAAQEEPRPTDDTPGYTTIDGSATAESASMPDLTALLQDDEVLDMLQTPETTKYLRQICIDPSVIDSLMDKPEIKFLVDKIKAQNAKEKAQAPQ